MNKLLSKLITQSRQDFVVPDLPSADDPDVTRWLDRQGTLCGLGHRVAEQHWIHVPDIGSYYFTEQSDTVGVVPLPSVTMDAVLDRFTRTVWPTVLQVRGFEVLHASAVMSPRGVVAFCAGAETGKSTLAYGLQGRGYSLWADDAVVLNFGERISTIPLPFKSRLRPASAVYFGHAQQEAFISYRWESCENQETEAQKLRCIVLLERCEAQPEEPFVDLSALSGAAAFAQVLAFANFFSLRERACKQRTVKNYMRLVTETPVLRLRFQSGLDKLETLLDHIDAHLLSSQIGNP